ncbi:MAG: hypothetical protein ACRD2I_28135 [Vicinamibacterales bacterium]
MSIRILLVVVLTVMTSMVQAAEPPLVVSDVVTGESSHVRLTNTSHQPVTAWSLAAITEPAPGRTHREVYTTDGYLSEATHGLPNAAGRFERMMPGESRELPLDPLAPGATVTVIAAVLDDRTATGDEAALAAIFANRVKERDALKAVVDAFNAVLPNAHGADALAALRQRFTVLVEREDSVPCHAALDAVQSYANKTQADQIDGSLRTYSDFVNREYQLAARHSERK